MNNNEVLTDFSRRYAQTYVFVVFPDSSEESLFHVDAIDLNPDKLATMQMSSPDYGKIILNFGTSHTLKFKYPNVGVYQHGKDAVMFQRLPAKQYKHGICSGNSYFGPVWHRIMHGTNWIGHEIIMDAFVGKTFKFTEALKMLASKKYRSVALRNNFSLMLSTTSTEGLILLFWDMPVAFVNQQGEVQVLENTFENAIKQVTNE